MKFNLILLIIFCSFSFISCTDENKSGRVLESNGYTNIQFTGYNMFSCGEGDTFKTGFTAKSPNNQVVSGTVCCGVFKGCTIRFD